ncbi:unnamed protein product [Amoebophrya sp. A25]|nr:unnamed protein product [Amoebophrya sp. A25]|eukprot:GSA25T00010272001.1
MGRTGRGEYAYERTPQHETPQTWTRVENGAPSPEGHQKEVGEERHVMSLSQKKPPRVLLLASTPEKDRDAADDDVDHDLDSSSSSADDAFATLSPGTNPHGGHKTPMSKNETDIIASTKSWTKWWSYFSLSPVTLIIIVCMVDAADRALIDACYKPFEKDFGFRPRDLGFMTLCQLLSASIALPFWGAALPKYGARKLLGLSCTLWAGTTFLSPWASNIWAQCFVRLINGAALSGVMPVSQAVLADVIPEERRGAAFGTVGSLHTIAKVVVTYFVISAGDNWRWGFYIIGSVSFLLIYLIQTQLPEDYGKSEASREGYGMMAIRIMRKIVKIPSFCVLVLQGVAGGTPWQTFSFLNMYWLTLGFSNEEAATIASVSCSGAIFGAFLGGRLGDFSARLIPDGRGRIFIAQLSVAGGVPFFILMLTSSVVDGSSVMQACTFGFLFYVIATWCPFAANQPICAELVTSSAERAQILALWVLIEGTAGAVFGSPIVGLLSEAFGYDLAKAKREQEALEQLRYEQQELANGGASVATSGASSSSGSASLGMTGKSSSSSGGTSGATTATPQQLPLFPLNQLQETKNAEALSSALKGLGIVCWSVCFLCWTVMYWTFPRDREKARKEQMLLDAQQVEQRTTSNERPARKKDGGNLLDLEAPEEGVGLEEVQLASLDDHDPAREQQQQLVPKSTSSISPPSRGRNKQKVGGEVEVLNSRQERPMMKLPDNIVGHQASRASEDHAVTRTPGGESTDSNTWIIPGSNRKNRHDGRFARGASSRGREPADAL